MTLDDKRQQRRVRGAVAGRAAARRRLANRTKRQARVVTRPAARKPAAPAARPAPTPRKVEISPETQAEIDQINRDYTALERDGQLSDIYDAVGEIETKLTKMPLDLDALRRRGYVHSGQLGDRLAALDEKWDELMPKVEAELNKQVPRLDRELDGVERKITLMSGGSVAAISAAKTAVSAMQSKVSAAKSAVRGMYDDLERELYGIENELRHVDWIMDQLDEAPEIRLREAEGPIAAVETIWQKDGKEGPKGVLYLTDQRLLFEQKEEVVTKKRFGIFKADSEMVQKLELDIDIHNIDSVQHSEEGGFMGMGKDDILELVCSADAPVSRARFHLKGQDSSDWAGYIKRVQTGEIDDDRDEEYLDDIEEAQALSGSFPAQCPNCFAAVPPPPRGVTSVKCEFCGSVITPS
ncbi:MAG: hypothetical protein WAM60_07020 [Candidatus Promineifilaceae bacterium]